MQTRTPLVTRSLDILREGQVPTGAFLACPTFPTYRYSWFRDGTFIAHALDLWEDHDAARRFYDWGCRVIVSHAEVVQDVLNGPEHQVPPRYLHTRYTAEGTPGDEDWPNFQLDGFGTFLWGIVEHRRLSSNLLPEEWGRAVELLVAYIGHLWRAPNYDCWEEFPDNVHLATLGALSAGLHSAAGLGVPRAAATAAEIDDFMFQQVRDSVFPKFVGSDAVDSSILWTCAPFNLFPVDHPVMAATIDRVRTDLVGLHGGVHRYAADVYYGGGPWILLTAGLAECLLEAGHLDEAEGMLHWIEEQATPDGELPEQVPVDLNVPGEYEPWVGRWGEIASPLLWSHAAYLRLYHRIEMYRQALIGFTG